MKYDLNRRLEIGRQVFEGELGLDEAALKYGVNKYTVRDYFRLYKADLSRDLDKESKGKKKKSSYDEMDREALILEIMNLKARLLLLDNLKPVEVVDRLSGTFRSPLP